MADPAPPAPPAGESAPAGPTLFTRIAVMAFIGTIVLGECLAALWLIPGQQQTEALARERIAATLPATPDVDEEPADTQKSEKPLVEVPLGDYSITAYQPLTNTTLRIDFELFGAVLAGEDREFHSRYETSKHRFREQVIVTIRNSDVGDLTDPGLGLIKRKILEKVNRQLGKPLLRGVVFSQFSFVEQ